VNVFFCKNKAESSNFSTAPRIIHNWVGRLVTRCMLAKDTAWLSIWMRVPHLFVFDCTNVPMYSKLFHSLVLLPAAWKAYLSARIMASVFHRQHIIHQSGHSSSSCKLQAASCKRRLEELEHAQNHRLFTGKVCSLSCLCGMIVLSKYVRAVVVRMIWKNKTGSTRGCFLCFVCVCVSCVCVCVCVCV